MAKFTQTIQEARDRILTRLNAVGSSDWQTRVIEQLNHAVVFVSTCHDWKYLRKKDTIITTDATGLVTLPSDCDRILSIHEPGADYFLAELEPLTFEQYQEDASVDSPMFWCVRGYAQDTSTESPSMQIEIYTAPASGASYEIWYIKTVDEILSSDLSDVPNIPPHIWELVVHKAMVECLKLQESPQSTINTEERHFMTTLELMKRREDRGGAHRTRMRNHEEILSYRNRRGISL